MIDNMDLPKATLFRDFTADELLVVVDICKRKGWTFNQFMDEAVLDFMKGWR